MLTLSRTVPDSTASPTALIAERMRRYLASGRAVVNLTSGEPDFPVPRHIKEAAIIAIEQNRSRYAPAQGIPELIDAVRRKLSRENGIHVEPDQILISNGAKQCVYNALRTICNTGDEVVLIAPHCPDYPVMVRLVGGVPITVKTSGENSHLPDSRAVRRAVNQKTKAILLNSPSNPTGRVYPPSLLEEIAAIARESGVYVISDELYEKLILDDRRHCSIGALKSVRDQVVTINGLSMACAMSGWRIGYMCGPHPVIEAATALQSQVTFSVNTVAQHTSVAALDGSTQNLEEVKKELRWRRDYILDKLSTFTHVVPVRPECGFFMFLDAQGFMGRTHGGSIIRNSVDLAMWLLDTHNVATSPGSVFGDDNCLRISYACSQLELESGIRNLATGLGSLR
jgi:aspartate aminotransferase